jgi:hypothetical protein
MQIGRADGGLVMQEGDRVGDLESLAVLKLNEKAIACAQ